MFGFTVVSWNHAFSFAINRFEKTLTVFVLTAAVATASAASPALSRISCGKNAYSGPGTDACSVYLTAKATGNFYVTLKSNDPAVKVPSGVTVKPGTMSTGFNATVAAVTSSQTATITGQAKNGLAKTFSITLSPASTAGTAALNVNATSIAFGSVVVNTQVSQPVTLSSTGTAALTVNSATVSGTGFSISGATFPTTLNPGQSLTLEVRFDPAATGSYTGQLTIGSSVSTKTVALSGTGTSHQVDLSWASPASSSDPAVGYNIYRAPSGSTSYQRLNAAVESLTSYTDSTVQSGTAYSYYVKSVDAKGVESTPSNVTSVTVP